MNLFLETLERLKRELRVSKDLEVANFLGLSKTAFAERKKRAVFPEEKLWLLAAERPDLDIDVLAVLTGISSAGQAEIARHSRASELLPASADTYEKIKAHSAKTRAAMRAADLATDEKELLKNYRAADDSGKKLIEGTAALAAKSTKKEK